MQQDFRSFIRWTNRLRQEHRTQFMTTLDPLNPEATRSHGLQVAKKHTRAAGVEAAVTGATSDL